MNARTRREAMNRHKARRASREPAPPKLPVAVAAVAPNAPASPSTTPGSAKPSTQASPAIAQAK
jgi:hypothetical protein